MWRTLGFCTDLSIMLCGPEVEKGPTCVRLEFHSVAIGWA